MTTMDTPAKISTVVIVDDHPLVVAGIKSLLDMQEDLEIVGEAAGETEALGLVDTVEPDIALVDLSLKEGSGLSLIKALGRKYPEMIILAVSMHDEYTFALRCIKAGARGYIMKQEGTGKILEAIRRAQAGEVYLSENMMRRAVDYISGDRPAPGASPADHLSDRELELFQLTGQGLQIPEIAERMGISPRTVEVHRSHIKKKLGLRTSTEIFQVAYDWLRDTGQQV